MGESIAVLLKTNLDTGQLYAQSEMTFCAIANTTVNFHDVELVSI